MSSLPKMQINLNQSETFVPGFGHQSWMTQQPDSDQTFTKIYLFAPEHEFKGVAESRD